MVTESGDDNVLARAVREFVERLRPVVLQWPEAHGADPDTIGRGLLASRASWPPGSCAPTAASATPS